MATSYLNKRLAKKIERVDQILSDCKQRGLDPVHVLQKAVAQHDRKAKRCRDTVRNAAS